MAKLLAALALTPLLLSTCTTASLRTFPVWLSKDGAPVGCDAVGVPEPVYGVLDGNQADVDDPVWLRTAAGTKLSIVWPERFTARFAPSVTLYNEAGEKVASAGDMVLLQVSLSVAAGTFDDPYYASGILLAGPDLDPLNAAQTAAYEGCYPRKEP